MKRLSLFVLCLLFFGVMTVPPAYAEAQGQLVIPAGSRPSSTASGQNFTGNVRIDPAFETQAPQRVYVPTSPLSRVRAPTGTPTRWAKPCSLRSASG